MTRWAGTATLLAFHLRRDALMLSLWATGLVILYWSQAVSVEGLYRTQAEFDAAAELMGSNPAFIAMAGPARALNTVGGQVAWQAMAFGAVMAGIMNMLLAGRHLRGEEESGRDELVRATGVGRDAPMAATALLLLVANVGTGVLVGASLVLHGLAVPGSVAIGVALASTGLVFGALALVAVQVSGTLRGAYGWCGVGIAVAFLLRAVGDVGAGALSWASPIGWGQAMRPYSGERWWPVLLSLAAVVVLTGCARLLFARRDLGSGLVAPRAGRARASQLLASSTTLALRLQRPAIIGWTLAMLATGLAYGSIGDRVGDLVGDSELTRQVFGGATGLDLVAGFYASAATTLAIIGSTFVVAAVLRVAKDESDGHADVLLAAGVPRWRWALGHLTVAVLGAFLIMLAAGVGLAVGNALATGRTDEMIDLEVASLAQLPAMVAVGVLALVLVGARRRMGPASWLVVGWCAVVAYFGDLWDLPAPLRWLSPFDHLAAYPAEPFDPGPILAMTALAAAAGLVGLALLRERDLAGA